MDMFDLASTLFGDRGNPVAQGSTLTATGSAASADGTAYLVMDADVTPAEGVGDDTDQTVIDVPTSPSVAEGDEVIMTLVGEGPLKTPVVMANPGFGDRMQTQVDSAEELAQQAEDVAQEAAEEVEQVRQDVADFRDDVATTYATKVEREDGDDAVKTWVTTNYTNSNDLATTYATKTLVSQTKDAIELAASQTYETQSDAAATYATKAALTVGLDGIRSEVAEDYQPKGDYATTASMNSAIQQSASSIESSVAATYETKSDASTTYATKTEVQQTASGLDTRITTAQSTANSAKSAVDNLQVGGTNLLLGTEDWSGRSVTIGTVTSGTKGGGQVLTYTKTATSGNNDLGRWNGFGPLEADEDYTLSFWAKADQACEFYSYLFGWSPRTCTKANSSQGATSTATDGAITSTLSTEWQRYWVTFHTASPQGATNNIICVRPRNLAANVTTYYVASPKLEHGTLATDWSPAPEDMATEADLDAEVTERQTLIRQFGGGVLAGYVGNAIAALVNAAGSFDVVRTAWTDGVPSILGTLARYAASGISLFDAAGNVLAEFASDHVRIGGDVPDGTGVESAVQFFDQTETHDTDLTASTYFDGDGSTYQTMQSTVNLSSTLADEGKAIDTGSSGTAALDLVNMLENGISDVGEQHNEVTAALVADASYSDGATTSHAAVRATASTTGGSDLSYAELIADALGIGENEGSIDYYNAAVVKSAIVPVTLFTGTYAQTYNTSVTLSETAAHFSRLLFVCENNDGERTSVTVTDPNGKNFNVVMLTIAGPSGTGTYAYMKAKSFSINGTSVTCRTYTYNGQTIYRHGSVTLRNGVAVSATQASEEIGIVKVLGWR